jgi:hypothetical protein
MEIHEVHQLIEKVCPISGLSQTGQDQYSIHFNEDATDENKAAAQAILDNLPFYAAKLDKLKQIDADFESNTNQGWDSGQGFKLGLTTQDVSLLVGLFVLAKEGAVLGINPPPVIDTNGVSHELTMQELTMLMLQYGNARAELSKIYAARRKAVENATTIEEINNI